MHMMRSRLTAVVLTQAHWLTRVRVASESRRKLLYPKIKLTSWLLQLTTRWVGWPGGPIPEGQDQDTIAELLAKHQCFPVWMTKELLDLYYNAFCNGVLWQLFHYVPVQNDFKLSETHTLEQQWHAYRRANQLFADAVLSNYHDGDVVWIQDYHLMLLPEMLKRAKPAMTVRFLPQTNQYNSFLGLLAQSCTVHMQMVVLFAQARVLGVASGMCTEDRSSRRACAASQSDKHIHVAKCRLASSYTHRSPPASTTALCPTARNCFAVCSRQT
jgi:Glycosyltransferase family 20